MAWKDIVPGDMSMSSKALKLYNSEYKLAALDPEELAILNAQMPTLLAAPTSVQRMIQEQRLDAYVMAIRATKEKLNGPKFRGVNPSDTELGIGPIRPIYTFDPTTTLRRTTWLEPGIAAVTWTDFIGAGAGIGYQLGRDFGLVITHLISYVTPTPLLSEVRFVFGRTQLLPLSVRPIRIGDDVNGISIYPVPTVFCVPRDNLRVQVYVDNAGGEEIELGGFVIGLGSVLNDMVGVWTP